MRILPILFLLLLSSLILPHSIFADEQEATLSAKVVPDQASPSAMLEMEDAQHASPAAKLTEQTADERSSEWIQDANGSYTVNNLVTDKEYAPFQNMVAIRFTSLPPTLGTLSAKRIAEYVYEFASSMEDGTFRYDLTLPLPQNADEHVVVLYSEDGITFTPIENEKVIDESSRTVTMKNLTHFTIFTVTTVSDFNAGVSTNTTVTDVGGSDGSVANTLGAETVDQSQTTGTTTESFDNTKWLAQTFTASQSGLLTTVTLSLKRAANTDGNVTIEIRDTELGIPGTTTLAIASLSATLLTTSQADYDFSFATPSAVLTGTSYAIVLYRSGSGTITADYTWYRGVAGSGNDQYTNGSRFTSSDSGATWVEQTIANPGTGDLRFAIVRRSYETLSTHASEVINAGAQSSFTELSWTETLGIGTDITFEVRGSSTSFAKTDDLPSWISLGTKNSPVPLTNVLIQSLQYFQWRATLLGTATTSATLKDVSVTYNVLPTTTTSSSSSPSVDDTQTSQSSTTSVCSDAKPGSAPTLTHAISGDGSVTLNWNKATDPLTYYLVAYGTIPGTYSFGNPNAGGSDTTSYTVEGLTNGVLYYFSVRAGNGCTPGDFSNELAATPNTAALAQTSPKTLEAEPTVLGEETGKEIVHPTPTPSALPLQKIETPTFLDTILTMLRTILSSLFSFLQRIR